MPKKKPKDPRWVHYWADIRTLRAAGYNGSIARRIAWARNFGTEIPTENLDEQPKEEAPEIAE